MGKELELTEDGLNAADVAKSISSRHQAMLRAALQEATYVFTEPVGVTDEDRLHGVGGIIERKLSEAGVISAATSPQKKNHMVDVLEKHLQALGSDALKKLGFGSGTVRIIRTGDILDLSILDKKGWVQAIR